MEEIRDLFLLDALILHVRHIGLQENLEKKYPAD